LIVGLAFFYLRNIISVFKFFVTADENMYATSLVFTMVWMIPSIVMSMVHYFFYKDTLDHNEKILNQKNEKIEKTV
jgi:hypothetical protein